MIDDEQHCIETLSFELEQFPNVEIIAKCSSGKEGIEQIKKLKPDLVFLDIDMPYMNGFEVLRSFEKVDFNVIFITAFDEFAIKAFKYAALDYLLKPVDHEELELAISKVKNVKQKEIKELQVEMLLNNLKGDHHDFKKIILPTSEGLEFIELDHIIYCKADSNYTHIFLQNGQRLVVAKTLKNIEQVFDNKRFFRSHNSYLINLDKIKRYVKGDGGYILMQDDSMVSISKSKREVFAGLLNG
jgi:two-component system LytT family response regulator